MHFMDSSLRLLLQIGVSVIISLWRLYWS